MTDDNRAFVKELSSAVSTQAQVANRTWLALMTVAFFAVLPHAPKNGNLSLPFNLGEINATGFHLVIFLILVVLAIAFASAHAQQMRAQDLAQRAIESLSASEPIKHHIHIREFFDMVRMPSLNRVAPLAQFLRGPYQFYETRQKCPKWRRLLSGLYYGLLKLTSLLVYFTLPFWAMWLAYRNVLNVTYGFSAVFISFVGLLAISALIVVLLEEMKYASTIAKILRG